MKMMPKITPQDFDKIPRVYNDCRELFEEFLSSGLLCARIESHNYSSVNYGVNSLNRAAKHFGYEARAFSRGGVLYLVRQKEN